MMRDKFPIRIIRGDNPKSPFKATTVLDRVSDECGSVRQDLSLVERDYTALVLTINHFAEAAKSDKRKDPRLYWRIGDEIVRFLSRIESIGFYLSRQNDTLARDTGISKSSTKKILTFRRRFPKVSLVNPSIPWAHYRANKVALPE